MKKNLTVQEEENTKHEIEQKKKEIQKKIVQNKAHKLKETHLLKVLKKELARLLTSKNSLTKNIKKNE